MIKTCSRCQSSIDVHPEATIRCPNCDTQNGPRTSDELATIDTHVPVQLAVPENIGPYQLLRRCGVGTFGTVWQALDTRLNRVVALKISNGQFETDAQRSQFRREAIAAAALCHSAIVSVFDVISHGRGSCIVCRFVDGQSLAYRMADKRDRLSQAAVVEIMVTVAEAVQHAHERGIIHRDLKPANILIDRNSRPHISDFGLARIQSSDVSLSESGRIVGTPAYMAPEQAAGRSGSVGPASDVYSLGVILYELLTGHRPYTADDADELLLQKLTQEPSLPTHYFPGLHPELVTICMTAMARQPADRFRSAGAMAAALRAFAQSQTLRLESNARAATSSAHSMPATTSSNCTSGSMDGSSRRRVLKTALGMTGAGLLSAIGVTQFGDLVRSSRPRNSNRAEAETRESRESTVAVPPGKIPVVISTSISGATIAIVPVDSLMNVRVDRIIRPAGVTPVTVPLEPGKYRIEAFHPRHDAIAEVERVVPTASVAAAATVNAAQQGSVSQAGEFRIPMIVLRPYRLLSRLIDCELVAVAGGRLLPRVMPPALRSRFAVPIDDFVVVPRRIRRHMIESVPATRGGRNNLEAWNADELPVVDLSLQNLMGIAEQLGMRLIDEEEHEYLATNGGSTPYPWGDTPPAEFACDLERESDVSGWYGAVTRHDACRNNPEVHELYSGFPEWVMPSGISPIKVAELRNGLPEIPLTRIAQQKESDAVASLQGIARGSMWCPAGEDASAVDDPEIGAASRRSIPLDPTTRLPIGFRFARSVRPRYIDT